MNVRIRRLRSDYEQIRKALQTHQAIRIKGASGNPPDRYQIEYDIRSLVENADGSITERHQHLVEVYLTLSYPRQAPQCRMLTPVFHPNIAPHAICIGDHWAAGESLLNLITRIGEMLAYQSYNVKSPLNGTAARWVDDHLDLLPTDARDLTAIWSPPPEAATPAVECCANCHSTAAPLQKCSNGHLACENCLIECAACGKTYCLLCGLETCSLCSGFVCEQCKTVCPQCLRTICSTHLSNCDTCGKPGCPDCTIECGICGRKSCLEHLAQCAQCRTAICLEHTHTCVRCNGKYCSEHFNADLQICNSCRDAASGAGRVDTGRSDAGQTIPPVMTVRCPGCTTQYRLTLDHAGKRLMCPKCKTTFSA